MDQAVYKSFTIHLKIVLRVTCQSCFHLEQFLDKLVRCWYFWTAGVKRNLITHDHLSCFSQNSFPASQVHQAFRWGEKVILSRNVKMWCARKDCFLMAKKIGFEGRWSHTQTVVRSNWCDGRSPLQPRYSSPGTLLCYACPPQWAFLSHYLDGKDECSVTKYAPFGFLLQWHLCFPSPHLLNWRIFCMKCYVYRWQII